MLWRKERIPYLLAVCLEVQMRMSIIQTSDASLLPCVSWDICEHSKNWEYGMYLPKVHDTTWGLTISKPT